MSKFHRVLSSRMGAITLLIIGTCCDLGVTYACVRDHLSFDGNPLVRVMSWTQLIAFQVIVQAVFVGAFLVGWPRQPLTWPQGGYGFVGFLKFRLKNGFATDFRWQHVRRELVYVALLLVWVPTAMHFVAALVAASPLLGGPSFLDVGQAMGVEGLRRAQYVVTVPIVAVSFLAAHYPLYVAYLLADRGQAQQPGRGDAEDRAPHP